MTGDSPSGDSLLVLNAKYHPSEADRSLAGRELVLAYTVRGNHAMLAAVVRDDGFTEATRREAADALENVIAGLLDNGPLPEAAAIVADRSIPYRSREKIGLALAASCRKEGQTGPLVSLLHSRADCPHETLEETRRAVIDIALDSFGKTGDRSQIEAFAGDKSLPAPIQQFFGMKLFEFLSFSEDLPGLLRLAEGKSFHEEPRKAATFKLFNFFKSTGSFTSMQAMVENHALLYEARKAMALMIADICIESGNYPLLVGLSRSSAVPVNIRLDVEDRVGLAAGKALENAIAAGDKPLLASLSNDERLAEQERERAKSALGKLELPSYDGESVRASRPPPISDSLAAALARKLSRGSQPPPPTRK